MMKNLIALGLFLVSSGVLAADWAKGEVRRIDIENKKLTIKHEEIKSLDMPPMSMVFYVENSDILKGINPGDKVEFIPDQKGTKLFVKQIKQLK
jgi:Cu(I)/Ag(I) efflux system protein CusF